MIRTISSTDVINGDVESFVVSILKGIEIADRLSASYTLEITRDDVAVIANALKDISSVEVS